MISELLSKRQSSLLQRLKHFSPEKAGELSENNLQIRANIIIVVKSWGPP